nr:diguanylate cyclase [Gammaproteobacteria bacterium]
MRLANYIRAEIEPILQDWEDFAKSIYPARHMDQAGLRDHAKGMLLEIADDLDTHQSESEQTAKSKGDGADEGQESSADRHGGERQTSGFSIMETLSEFRALRASVLSHWTKAYPAVIGQQLEDLTRFHEAIDQALAESLEQYATVKEMETRLFAAILAASPDPICVLDPEGRITYANKATADLFALDPKAIIGQSTFSFWCAFAPDFQRNVEKVNADQSTYRGKFRHTFGSGQGARFEYLLAPVLNEQRNTEAIVCVIRDITEQALAEEKTWHDAHHDFLTALPNRRLFLDRLGQEFKHAKRNSLPLSVLFIDLDEFKQVNDSYGHETGDRLLSGVAERLTDCVREADTVARLGGDEFTVILTGAKQRQDVALVAQTIIDALVEPFLIAQQHVQISVSIGISSYPQDASSALALLEAADKAMYSAKESGSNQMRFYDISDKTATNTA